MTIPSKASSYWWWKAAADRPYAQLLLALLSGALAFLAWHPLPTTLFIFFAFVPILLIGEIQLEKKWVRQSHRFYGYAYLAHLVWNVGATWWIWNATPGGALGAIFCNAALQCLPWLAYFKVRRRWGLIAGLCALVIGVLLFEYVHLRWELTWPWLNIGNVFAGRPEWVQWYEWTGALGGTAWVLWVNAAFFLGFCADTRNRLAKGVAWATSIVLLGITISYCLYPWRLQKGGDRVEVVVAQPNIDPYLYKFETSSHFIPYERQLEIIWQTSQPKLTQETDWLLCPETSIDATLPEAGLEHQPLIRQLRGYLTAYPNLSLVIGATTYRMFTAETAPAGARFTQGFGYYEVYNSALLLRPDVDSVQVYHKSKLVPGAEGIPYPSVLGIFTISLGGTVGGLGRQPAREVFLDKGNRTGMAPIICYESIFGDFVEDFSGLGAQYLGIITNDAWWGRTAGHVQHLNMARLRAIENRRWIARSANTGISGYINPLGAIVDTLGYERQGALRRAVPLSSENTLYEAIGDEGMILFALFVCGLTLWGFRQRTDPQQV